MIAGAFLSVIAYMGYYSAYAFVIWRTVTGVYSIGLWYLLSGAILQASNNIQQIFSTLSGIADQALFLTDLLAFFDMQPTIQSKPNALPAPRPIRPRIRIPQCLVSLSGKFAAGAEWVELPSSSRESEWR